MGEVTELCPLPRAMDMRWWSASWTQQSPPQSRLLGMRGWGLQSPSHDARSFDRQGTNCHTTSDFHYHPWADGPACLGLRGQGDNRDLGGCVLQHPKPSQV